MKLERAREFRRLSLTGDNALQLHLQESEKLKAEYAGIAAAAGFTKNLELHAVIDDRSLRAELNAHDETARHAKVHRTKWQRFFSNLTNSQEIRMIFYGLLGGIKQVLYVVILLYLLIYVYAVAGIIFFSDNDPWNFSTVEFSMLVLMRVATLDTWGENFYTNYYGCADFPGGLNPRYAIERTKELFVPNDKYGGIKMCDTPVPRPTLAVVYYYSFITLGTFGVLSTVVGIIGNSMESSILASRAQQDIEGEDDYIAVAEEATQELRKSGYYTRATTEVLQVLRRAVIGEHISTKLDYFIENSTPGTFKYNYFHLSWLASEICKIPAFDQTVTGTIFLSAFCAGIETFISQDPILALQDPMTARLNNLNAFIQAIFTIDCVFKIVAEPYFWKYFNDAWNKFDAAIVVVSYIPLENVSNKFLLGLKMLRLCRLLKMINRFKTLKIIISALLSSARQILMIAGIMFGIILCLSGVGCLLFSKNDPKHFSDVSTGFISMFIVMTLDSWAATMYTNLFGCDVIGYEEQPDLCTDPEPRFLEAALFFPISVAILTWIIATMFIGLLATSMGEAEKKRNHDDIIDQRSRRLIRRWKAYHSKQTHDRNVKKSDLILLRNSFDYLDFNQRGLIGSVEIFFIFEYAGMEIHSEEFSSFWNAVPKDNPRFLDYSEFLWIIFHVRDICIKLNHHTGADTDANPAITPIVGNHRPLEDNEVDVVNCVEHEGKAYLRSSISGTVYNFDCPNGSDERDEIGIWNNDTIEFYSQSKIAANEEYKRGTDLTSFLFNTKTYSILFPDFSGERTTSSGTPGSNNDGNEVDVDDSGSVQTSTTPRAGGRSRDMSCIIGECFVQTGTPSQTGSPAKQLGGSDENFDLYEDYEDVVVKIEIDGVTYLKSKASGKVYHSDDADDVGHAVERHEVGVWDNETKSIKFHPTNNDTMQAPTMFEMFFSYYDPSRLSNRIETQTERN